MFHDGSLGMELYADGTRLVGALNALYHVNARHMAMVNNSFLSKLFFISVLF
jgi:hypothetical protein